MTTLQSHNCPKCSKEMELQHGMFYWRGKYFTGYVCKDCNALYENEDDSMFKYIKEQSIGHEVNE